MFDMIKSIFKGGMAPSETADMVLDAIKEERFYVLTHPEHNPQLQIRVDAIVGGGAPPVLIPG